MIFNPTSRARVRDAEALWISKFLLRIVTIIAALIASGLIGWAFTNSNFDVDYSLGYFYGTHFLLPWDFITLGISILWNIANAVVRLSRPRPMHPGANVALDLLLWMALLTTGIFALVAGIQSSYFSPASLADQTSSSQEVQNSNGTYSEVYGNYGTYPNGTYGFIPEGTPGTCPGFSSCAESITVGALIDRLAKVEIVGASFTFLAVLLHFILFVWACVDVHRRNDSNTNRRAARIAQTLVAEMAERGGLPAQQSSRLEPQQQQRAPLLAANGTPMGESSRGVSTEDTATDRKVVGYGGNTDAKTADGDADMDMRGGGYGGHARIGNGDEIRAAGGVFPVDNLGVHPARR